MLKVTPRRSDDTLQIVLRQNKIIARTEFFDPDASIDFGLDDTPIGLTFYRFYTARRWPLTEEIVVRYRLVDWQDDFRTIHDAFFDDNAQVPLIVP